MEGEIEGSEAESSATSQNMGSGHVKITQINQCFDSSVLMLNSTFVTSDIVLLLGNAGLVRVVFRNATRLLTLRDGESLHEADELADLSLVYSDSLINRHLVRARREVLS